MLEESRDPDSSRSGSARCGEEARFLGSGLCPIWLVRSGGSLMWASLANDDVVRKQSGSGINRLGEGE